jgi:hypothetical protein
MDSGQLRYFIAVAAARFQKKNGWRGVSGEGIMSAIGIDSGLDLAAARSGADEISLRLKSLPASSCLCAVVLLRRLGGDGGVRS